MTESDAPMLLAVFVIPLATALLLMLIPSKERTLIIALTAVSSFAMFVISVVVFLQYDFEGAQFQGVRAWTYMENIGILGEDGIQLKVGIDGIAASMVLLTGIVIMPGTWVSWKVQDRMKDFFILLYVLTAGVFGWLMPPPPSPNPEASGSHAVAGCPVRSASSHRSR